MDSWSPHFTVGVLVLASYVLLAVFGSRERGYHGHAVPPWHSLRRILHFRREPHRARRTRARKS